MLISLLFSCSGGLTPMPPLDSGESASPGNIGDCDLFRFEPLHQLWTLPAGYPDSSFHGVTDSDGVSPNWTLMDLDRDGLLDIVVTLHPDVEPVGTSKWLVHAGGSGGFENAGTGFELPGGYPSQNFAYTTDVSSSPPNWVLGGLGGSDMVAFEFEGLPEVGNSQLLRHTNSGSSFENAANSIALPPGYPSMEFRYGYDASTSNPNWSLTDIDGDGDRDLVITGFDGIEGVGEGRWLVHLLDGGAFSSNGSTWVVPSLGGDEMRYTDDRVSGGANWDLIDLHGDGVPELVVAWQEGVEGVGDTHWQVYSNLGTAFDTNPQYWILPSGLSGLTWAVDRSDDGLNWTLADMDADGSPDLVVTTGGAGANGTGRWEVYRNDGQGFAEEPQVFLLPNGLESGMARRFDSSDFVVADVDGDGLLDLLLARNGSSSDLELGVAHWYRYSAICD